MKLTGSKETLIRRWKGLPPEKQRQKIKIVYAIYLTLTLIVTTYLIICYIYGT